MGTIFIRNFRSEISNLRFQIKELCDCESRPALSRTLLFRERLLIGVSSSLSDNAVLECLSFAGNLPRLGADERCSLLLISNFEISNFKSSMLGKRSSKHN